MNNFFIAFIIVLQVAGYYLGACVLFNEKKWNFLLPLIPLIVGITTYSVYGEGLDNMMFITVVATMVFCTMITGSWKYRINLALKTLFVVNCLEEMLESVVSLFLQLTNRTLLSSFYLFIIAEVLLLCIWILIKLLKQHGWKLSRRYANMLLKIVLVILAIALQMVIAGITYAEPYVQKQSFSIMGCVLSAFSYLGITTLGFFIIYVKNANDNYRELLELEEKLRTSQQYNYEILLAKEEETREFRHDINNHLICLREIVANGNLSAIEEYLNDMNMTIYHIQKKHFSTGNEIVDAIVNYYIQQLDEDVVLSVKGVCIHTIEISNMELCSIVSNLMQNAIDALHNQKHGEKYLKIRIDTTQDVFELKVSNSMEEEPVMKTNGLPVTSKTDKKHHGIGLEHVKKVIEQAKGLFFIQIKNKEFLVTVILPATH